MEQGIETVGCGPFGSPGAIRSRITRHPDAKRPPILSRWVLLVFGRMRDKRRMRTTLATLALLAAFGACSQDDSVTGGGAGGGDASADAPHVAQNDAGLARPDFIAFERTTSYDGTTDDLLTAGLGVSGLQGPAPAVSSPPRAAELRRLAVYSNYRAIIDTSPDGGFGRLFGPNVDSGGHPTPGDGKIAGAETIAFIDDRTGRMNVTVVIQVPATFDTQHPCIVLAASSGSRNVYGAIGNAGQWGLKRGCAVAYHDKGTGDGAHDLQNDVVVEIDGLRSPAAVAGARSNFTVQWTDEERTAFNRATPNRLAFKHAQSRQNPEMSWGDWGLKSIGYAFYVLNKQFGTSSRPEPWATFGSPWRVLSQHTPFAPANTMVIASSASNGGGAALLSAERDSEGLIDAVVVSEPQIVPPEAAIGSFNIRRGSNAPFRDHGKSLDDYATYANLYQPCAALAASVSQAPGLALVDPDTAQRRCTSLAAKGLLRATTLADRAAEALDRLHGFGYEGESDLLHASHYALAIPPVALNYVLSHGRFGVAENVCGFSYGATDHGSGAPIAWPAAAADVIFGVGNGIPPTDGVDIINNLSLVQGGTESKLDKLSVSRSTGAVDFNIDGALCLRSLVTGIDPQTGAALTGDALAESVRVRAGIAEVRATGNLHGKPVIIVAGRSDALVPINHASRAYFGAAQVVQGAARAITYYEITNGQHFDAFASTISGYAQRYVPVDVYLERALDAMYDHLRSGVAIPESQLVRTVPRGPGPGGVGANSLTASNVPPVAASPTDADRITFGGGELVIPE